MNNKKPFNTIDFPQWEDYSTTIEEINEVKDWYDNDTDLMVKNICGLMSFKKYYKDMLLYIQTRLDKHISDNEPLGLCLDSSKEVFDDIMICPCEKLYEEKSNNSRKMLHKHYWLEKWKEMRCDFEYCNEICRGNCSSCQYFPNMNLINCEEYQI